MAWLDVLTRRDGPVLQSGGKPGSVLNDGGRGFRGMLACMLDGTFFLEAVLRLLLAFLGRVAFLAHADFS